MKKIIMAIAISMLSISLFAQNVFENKNQLNIGSFNITNLLGNNNLGIGYKHNFKKGAFRIATGINYRNTVNKTKYDTFISTNQNFSLTPKAGYEFHYDFDKFRLFYGCDLTGRYLLYKNSFHNKIQPENDYQSENMEYGTGISPFIGIYYYFNNKFSVSTQTSFDVLYQIRSNKSNSSSDQYYYLTTNFSPLGMVSLNIHFGKK